MGSFGDEHLIVVLMDLFLAGSETTSRSLMWACFFMVKYPEVSRIEGLA